MSKRKAKPHPTEAQEHSIVFKWSARLERYYPELWFLHRIPSCWSHHIAEVVNLKKPGVKPGVSNIFLPVARQGYHGLYLELIAIGDMVYNTQADWINRVREQGYAAFVCFGADEAIGKIKWYLGIKQGGSQ